jgi:hypothetical protein
MVKKPCQTTPIEHVCISKNQYKQTIPKSDIQYTVWFIPTDSCVKPNMLSGKALSYRVHFIHPPKSLYLLKITVVLRKSIITALFCCISAIGLTQTITGNWNGTFADGMMKFPILLEFILNADSSYTVHSYTKLPDNKGEEMWVICDMYYEFMGKDSLYLEETRRISPDEKTLPSCLQKMYLKIKERKKILVLDGEWRNVSPKEKCSPGGSIYFSKKKTAE